MKVLITVKMLSKTMCRHLWHSVPHEGRATDSRKTLNISLLFKSHQYEVAIPRRSPKLVHLPVEAAVIQPCHAYSSAMGFFPTAELAVEVHAIHLTHSADCFTSGQRSRSSSFVFPAVFSLSPFGCPERITLSEFIATSWLRLLFARSMPSTAIFWPVKASRRTMKPVHNRLRTLNFSICDAFT